MKTIIVKAYGMEASVKIKGSKPNAKEKEQIKQLKRMMRNCPA